MGKQFFRIKDVPLSERGFWEGLRQEEMEELRMRADKPVMIRLKGGEWYAGEKGEWRREPEKARIMKQEEINRLVDYWCKDSRYAFQQELKNGFLTIFGGHRIGVCGEMVLDEKGKVRTIKNLSSLNIRFARECRTAAEGILPLLYEGDRLQNTLIVSAPGGGKTTLLRDLVRRISDGSEGISGRTVGLIDERGELAASWQGVPQLDVGIRTDVLDGCPKEEGILHLLRSMGPQVIAVDELGEEKEIKALLKMSRCGCSILATIHGNGLEEVRQAKRWKKLWKEGGFTRVILLERRKGEFISRLCKEEDQFWQKEKQA